MKKQLLTTLMVMAALTVFSFDAQVYAQSGPWGNGPGEFIDENGDGFNDLAPDADGDGIPNKYDLDYERPQDGSGQGAGAQNNNGSGAADGTGFKKGGMENGNRGQGPQGPGDGSGECTAPETTTSLKIMRGFRSK